LTLFSTIRTTLTYKGGSGHWSYVLHRVTGLGVLLFLIIHVLDTALLGFGPEIYNKMLAIYRHPFFRVNEIFLFGSVLFHSLNGLRIVVIDFYPGSTRIHKRLFWSTMVLFTVIMIPVAIHMLIPIFKGAAS
jgi:succinate dehydrogenase / fumarate reductase cytochrome b subunit